MLKKNNNKDTGRFPNTMFFLCSSRAECPMFKGDNSGGCIAGTDIKKRCVGLEEKQNTLTIPVFVNLTIQFSCFDTF